VVHGLEHPERRVRVLVHSQRVGDLEQQLDTAAFAPRSHAAGDPRALERSQMVLGGAEPDLEPSSELAESACVRSRCIIRTRVGGERAHRGQAPARAAGRAGSVTGS
jgi:hypothetical protein